MTDRLQQKAEEIVREWLGKDPTNPTSKYIRSSQAFRYVEAGLTAGIAMAAEVCDERVITAYRYGNRESEQCAIAIRALAKGETQHG